MQTKARTSSGSPRARTRSPSQRSQRERFRTRCAVHLCGGFCNDDELVGPRKGIRGRLTKGDGMLGRVAVRAGSLAGVVALLYAGVALAAAGGRGTVTETQHEHNVVLFSISTANPCTGEPGTL